MAKTMRGQPARVGDKVEVTGHRVGQVSRTCEIVEVLGEPGREHYRVRWEDGHESVYFPADDAVIRRPEGGA